MKALLTGAAGFIGSHLVEAFLQRGVRVRCLVRPTSHLTWVKGFPVEIIYGDCREKDSLGPGVKDAGLVFHLAGATRAIDARTYTRCQKFFPPSLTLILSPRWGERG